MKVEGSVAVVTGAAGGIGLAVAQRLLEHGAHVVVTDLDAARTSAAVASLEPHGADRVV
ncbi:SDR family NAD(P)-dependent oxidoreductase, partial [Aeromicrobium sp. REDSEA-S32_B7]|uniref:SDR family NAD(P)-dependent oxidoreductase n=1 Tax=Aeromicrobium sp. REDSEA-S32_B7 TaxID=1811526 RepID=UPI000AD1798C